MASMNTAKAHYATHLGPVYSWMLGDMNAALVRSTRELDDLPLPLPASGAVVDLGAGLGLHSLPLAERGYSVVAIDSCAVLLDELRARCGTLSIATLDANLLTFPLHVTGPIGAILCMGDTLTHLQDAAMVEDLLAAAAGSLAAGGLFATTFRDYASTTLEGNDRFILVRSDEERILTCFLEYGDQHVTVHDVLTQREHGAWRQRVSSYPKLRLAPDWVVALLTAQGFAVRREAGLGGMVRVVGIKG
jgi:SAM-dependent methyltransferase